MFQTFSSSEFPIERSRNDRPRLIDEARGLIGRYPNLSEVELARLINLYRELSALDLALMLSDEELASSFDQFSADHRSKIRTPFRQYAALVACAGVGVAVVVWAIVS